MAATPLYIFPFNGNGIEALDAVDEQSYTFLGFIDDNPEKQKTPHPWPVWGRKVLQQNPDARVLAVPGGPLSFTQRKSHIEGLGIPESRFISLIHPAASIGKNVTIGHNCLIMAGVVLTSNARIGNHVCILPNTVVHHDSYVGDYTLIGSNVAVAGGTHVGANCYIGSGSNLINGIRIGARTLVGLGSNVIRDINTDEKVAGNPARSLKK